MTEKSPNKVTGIQVLGLFWDASKQYKNYLFLSLLQPVSQTILSVAVPFYASKVIASTATNDNPMQYFWLLLVASLSGLGLSIVSLRGNMKLQSYVMQSLHDRALAVSMRSYGHIKAVTS